jgi:hypothetical protein
MDRLFSVTESKEVIYVNINIKSNKLLFIKKYENCMKPDKINSKGKLCGWVYQVDTSDINKRTKIGREKVKARILKKKDEIQKKLKSLESQLQKKNELNDLLKQIKNNKVIQKKDNSYKKPYKFGKKNDKLEHTDSNGEEEKDDITEHTDSNGEEDENDITEHTDSNGEDEDKNRIQKATFDKKEFMNSRKQFYKKITKKKYQSINSKAIYNTENEEDIDKLFSIIDDDIIDDDEY